VRATALPAELGARDSGPFVGRVAELASLQSSWQRAIDGRRQLVLIAGEPGIGKTRLVGQVANELHRDGAVVLHGRCDPDVVFPYQPLAEAFRQLLQRDDRALDTFAASRSALGLLVPELATQESIGTADGAAERAALFTASAATLVFAAQRQPLLLVIDDAHWATLPTLHLVRHVLRATIGTRMLVAITYRDTELAGSPLGELVADLHNQTGVERITLGGLDEPAVAELIAAAGAQAEQGLISDLLRDTGGNPFFVIETLRHLADSGMGVAGPIRDVIALRVSRLPDATREHLAAAAVIGPRFDLDLLTAIGVPGDPLDAVEPAVDARLVREVGEPVGRFAFAHALIRQALLDDLGPTRAARLHEQAAGAIEQLDNRNDRAAEIAGHYLAAVRPEPLQRGARWALRAAESVTWRSAPEASLDLTTAALAALAEVPDHDLELEVNLLIEKAMALLVLQRNTEFLAVAGNAVKTARRAGSDHDFALAVATRACYTPTGTNDPTFITDIEEALAVVGDDELAVRSRLHSGMSVAVLVTMGDRRVAFDHARHAAELADRSGVFFDRWMSRFAGTLAAFCEPDPTELDKLGQELQSLGTEFGDENATCHGLRASAAARLIHGDLDGFAETLAECERRWAAIHNAWGAGMCAAARFSEACARGRFDEAEAAVNDLVPIMAADPNFAAIYAGQLVLLRIFQQRRAELDAFIGASAATFPGILELQIQHGSCRFELGDVSSAKQICRDVLSRPELTKHDFAELSRLGAAIELAVAVDEIEPLPMLIEAMLPYEGQILVVNLGIGMVGPVNRFLGAAAGALGDSERADRWFASALAWEEANGCVPMATLTRRWWDQARERPTRSTSSL
jgi:AAA ATPase-like protein